MPVIDPSLKCLQQRVEEQRASRGGVQRKMQGHEGIGLESGAIEPSARVLVQFTGDIAVLVAHGFIVQGVAGDVAGGLLPLRHVDALAALPQVVRIELSQSMQSELDKSLPDIKADLLHTAAYGGQGDGVVIGIIDLGIDFTHPGFRKADGKTRILWIWDQELEPENTETSPAEFGFGVEYSRADINAALDGDPLHALRHEDDPESNGHGTHVASIAAGNGADSGTSPAYMGVAPQADIVVVKNRIENDNFGDSLNAFLAVLYIFLRARSLNRPAVINISQGSRIGAHDGSSLLERAIDELLGSPGRSIVKSAGNEGNESYHASGVVAASASRTVRFNVPDDIRFATLDIWYRGADRFSILCTSPDNFSTTEVMPGGWFGEPLPSGIKLYIESVLDEPNNHDNRIQVSIYPEEGVSQITQGNWSFTLKGVSVSNGRFDAWIEDARDALEFLDDVDTQGTVTIPGTSRKIITVGSYVTDSSRDDASAPLDDLSASSSRGPTRDGRQAPTLTAPGEWIMSARASNSTEGSGPYQLKSGTSMAAPHVAGTIALMLQRNPHLTQEQIRKLLVAHARSDGFTGAVPNDSWGAGKLDAQAAVQAVCLEEGLFIEWRYEQFKYRKDDEMWEHRTRHSQPFMVTRPTLVPVDFHNYAFFVLDDDFEPDGDDYELIVYVQKAAKVDGDIPPPQLIGILETDYIWMSAGGSQVIGDSDDEIKAVEKRAPKEWIEEDMLLQPGDVVYLGFKAEDSDDDHSESECAIYASLLFPRYLDAEAVAQ